jgi:hypothetical protein
MIPGSKGGGAGRNRFFDVCNALSAVGAALKHYQTRRAFSLDASGFRQTLSEQELPAEAIAPYLSQGFAGTPYVCLRIPTGGGKTLLGAHAIARAARHYTGQERPVALWLVPTNTIRQQTLNALRQPGHPTARRWNSISAWTACA